MIRTCLTLLAVVLLATAHQQSASALAGEPEGKAKIGWIGPLTGPAAVLGVDAVPAMELAVEDLNASGEAKLELFVEDDQYETAKSVSAYNHLVHEKGIKIIFLFTYGGVFALAPRAKNDGVLFIDTLDCDEKLAALSENVICIAKSTEQLGELVADAAVDRHDEPAGLLYFNNDPFMGTIGEASIARFKARNASMPYVAPYAGGTSDFRTFILQAQSKKVKSLFFYGYDEMGIAMRQARTAGFKGQFYALNTISSPGFLKSAQGHAFGTIVGTYQAPRTERYREFEKRFEAKTNRKISFEVSTVPSYDAVRLIGAALKAGVSEGSAPKTVEKYLYSVKDYPGLSGPITVDADGAVRSLKNTLHRFGEDGLEPLSSASQSAP